MLSRKEISAEKTAVTVYTLTKGVLYVISSDRRFEAISPYPQEDESNVRLSRISRMKVGHNRTKYGKFVSTTSIERKSLAKNLGIDCSATRGSKYAMQGIIRNNTRTMNG